MAGREYWIPERSYYTGEQGYGWRKKANRINVFNLLNGILSFSTQDPPKAFQECTESNCIPRIETNNPISYGFRMREGKAKRTFKSKSDTFNLSHSTNIYSCFPYHLKVFVLIMTHMAQCQAIVAPKKQHPLVNNIIVIILVGRNKYITVLL